MAETLLFPRNLNDNVHLARGFTWTGSKPWRCLLSLRFFRASKLKYKLERC